MITKLPCFVCIAALVLISAAQTQDEYFQKLRVATDEAGAGNIAAAEADIKSAIDLDPARAAGWYELGSVLGQAADFPGAEAAFRRAIQLQPDLAKAHFSLALTLIANPQNKLDWPEAISECREALKHQPNYPEALNLLGAGLANTGKTDEAITTLQQAIQLAPSLAEAHLNLAMALESKDQLDAAAKEYRAAIAARAAYPEAVSGLGKLLFNMGKTSESERELDAALRLNPDLTDAHYTLARILRSLNQNKEAAVEFAEAKELIERQPDGVQASQLSNQALDLASKGDLAGAVVLLRKAIALKPDYGVPHYNLGLILADSGDLAGAAQELAKAISLLPGQYKTWFDLGRVLQRENDYHGAIQAVSWAAHLAPSDSSVRAELLSLRSAEPDQAAERHPVLQPKVGAASDTAADHFAFAEELNAEGDFQGAAGELLRTLSLQPAMVDARRSLAEAYLRLGENDRAVLEDYKMLRFAPEDAQEHIHLGQALLAEGDAEQAAKHFRLALHYQPKSAAARAGLDEAEKKAHKH
jgi:tetratricopeptide (TPR) repeat protein